MQTQLPGSAVGRSRKPLPPVNQSFKQISESCNSHAAVAVYGADWGYLLPEIISRHCVACENSLPGLLPGIFVGSRQTQFDALFGINSPAYAGVIDQAMNIFECGVIQTEIGTNFAAL